MHRLTGFQDVATCRGGVVAIGNFDGVHLGHRSMLARLVERARERRAPAVAMTFEPHPIHLLRPHLAPPRLTTIDRKAELIARSGADALIVYPTDRALLDLTPQEFFERFLLGELRASGLVEGPNFFFGRDRAGDVRLLHELCFTAGLTLDVVPAITVAGRAVSSSTIRELLASGAVDQAAQLLGECYRVRGDVVRGAERGRTIGFPTANLAGVETMLPEDGVYAGRVHHGGHAYAAAINIGSNPTFGEERRKIEIHLIDFAGDLYGTRLDVEFVRRLRDTRTFAGVNELRRQLQADIAAARAVAGGPPGS